MTPPDLQKSTALENKTLIWLVVVITIAFALILYPFMGAVLWAMFIAIIFAPLQERVRSQVGPRPTLAALLTLSVIVLIVILPLTMLGIAVVQEISVAVQLVRSGEVQIGTYFQQALDALPGWAHNVLVRFGLADLAAMQTRLTELFTQSGQFLTVRLLGIGQGTLEFVVAFFVMLYIVFFLLRDGEVLSERISRAIPLHDHQTERLLTQFVTVVRATVKGNIVVALIQGTLGGLAFWVLGLPGPLLWGALMAMLSLLPAVGAALVWGPVALYYLATGEYVSAIGLSVWGVLAIGLVDNVLRPILVGKETRMPDYLVLVSTLGGIAVFGLNGFVIGPVIAAMFIVAWNLLTAVREQERRGLV
jgi:predicted PurR-regulated permease PerM